MKKTCGHSSKNATVIIALCICIFLCACGTSSSDSQTQLSDSENTFQDNTSTTESTEITDISSESEPSSQAPAEVINTDTTEDVFSEEYCLDKALEWGIADSALYEDFDREISYYEMATLLKNAYDLQYGQNSNCFLDGYQYYFSDEGLCFWQKNEPITMADIASAIAFADAIYYSGIELDFKTDFWAANELANEQNPIQIGKIGNYYWDFSYMPYRLGEDGYLLTDCDIIANWDQLENCAWTDVSYLCGRFDRVSYDRLYTLPDDGIFDEKQTICVKDAILLAFHYYRSFYPEPEYVDIADVGSYDNTIITDELLSKDSALPDADNSHLPSEWHGIMWEYRAGAVWGTVCTGNTESFMNERDFQVLKDAGFNCVRLFTSWYHMQDPYMNTQSKTRLDDEIQNNPRMVNLQELRYYDQLIAWAIEYDMHIEINFIDLPGLTVSDNWDDWFNSLYSTNEIFTNKEVQEVSAEWWRMFAGRYSDIPNRYLSFQLVNEPDPETDEIYAEAFKPTVDAIWDVSPGRIIIADVSTHQKITGEKMAEMGCALSYHDYTPGEFSEWHIENMLDNPNYYTDMTWPYTDDTGASIDAEATKDIAQYDSGYYTLIKSVAESYGVGFIVNEWGYFGDASKLGLWNFNDGPLPIQSFETRKAYIKDKTAMYKADGVPWIAGSVDMIAEMYPYPETDADWYAPEHFHFVLDRNMVDLWKEINNTK